MNTHYKLNNTEFEIAFENCTLDAKLFSHEAHLRLAWIHINKYGIEQAIHQVTSQLQKFVKAQNAEEKYNATVTIAGMHAVHHFIKKSKTRNFSDFINENNILMNDFKTLIFNNYKSDVFESASAKGEYMVPDLVSFA